MTAPHQTPEPDSPWHQPALAAATAPTPAASAPPRGQPAAPQPPAPAPDAAAADQRSHPANAGVTAAQQAARAAAHARAAVPATGVAAAPQHPAAGPEAPTNASRAAAAAAAPRGPSDGPATYDGPQARGGRTLSLLQVLCWQIAIVIVLLGWQGRPIVTAATAAVATACLLVTALPGQGGWLYQWLGLRLRFWWRSRRHQRPGDPSVDHRLALLRFLQPATVLGEIAIDGQAVATIAHPAGLTAVLELAPGTHTLFGGPPHRLPNLVSLVPPHEPNVPPVTLQVLVRTEGPSVWPGSGAAPASYQKLTGGTVPTERRGWLVVQVRRTPHAYHDDDLRPALLNAIQRVRRRLRQEKLPHRLLGPQEPLAAASLLGRLDAAVPPENPPARETWQHVATGQTVQASFRISHWPTRPWRMDDLLTNLGPVTAGIAVTNDPIHAAPGAQIPMELVIRFTAADPPTLRAASERLRQLIAAIGGKVERLNGQQAAGFAATMPFGGFLS